MEIFVYDARGQLAAEYGGTSELTGTHYLTADHLGSTRMVTDEAKTPVMCRDYLPFGGEIPATEDTGRDGIDCYGEDVSRHKFTSYERDSESHLDFAQARYYSWAGGRFNSPDPENEGADPNDPQSWNMYVYGRNNPLIFVDPDGRVYRVCQADHDDRKTNCTYLSDAHFANFQEQNKNSLSFTGKGQISVGGNQIGTFEQVSVDLDSPAAEILRTAGVTADAHIKEAARDMALNAVGGAVLGPLFSRAFPVLQSLPLLRQVQQAVSNRNLRHIVTRGHLAEFRQLDSTMRLNDVSKLGIRVAEEGVQVGRNAFIKTVEIGGRPVRVKAVLNEQNGLRSVYVLK
jgi:RHS repeat-associated protein